MIELNQAQRAVVDGLLTFDGSGPRVDPDTVEHIRRGFTERTQWAVDALDEAGQTLPVNKYTIRTALQCETRWQFGGDFSWNVSNAAGSVAHRAAELLLVGRLSATPLDAVAAAIDLMCEDNSGFAAFLDDGPPARAAAVRADSVTHVSSLVDGFPPLPKRLLPRTEQSFQATLGGRTVLLNARPDLALGRPAGADACSLLVDLKTGTPHQSHVDDLRFYALVFMLRWGAPPWRIASFYAPDGSWTAEDVDRDVLEAAARRTSDAILRMTEIVCSHRPPAITPGPGCTWCALAETCEGPASLTAEDAH
ncbi:MAG TPA: PD-(D/E)XK nuclease family protein [Acidimicrobiales bacterium]|nr:PD-(D/E)XK nuclease family protein [Acidimicrobiales bacterium]